MNLSHILKFPHATAVVPSRELQPYDINARIEAQANAFATAVEKFRDKYHRLPDFDVLCFRGVHTTTDVVCEIWEEG